ncbi:hypothetical protein EYF80_037463 [Liparis tanakae]|uniref:Uncharacterized protein n=1 Tax=Liparis tanakae TaxID=230148 RepID=A0A4Z2GFX9_9TELE|nr:hypothetical protein EYF80_037463 [Liparis tanakae]
MWARKQPVLLRVSFSRTWHCCLLSVTDLLKSSRLSSSTVPSCGTGNRMKASRVHVDAVVVFIRERRGVAGWVPVLVSGLDLQGVLLAIRQHQGHVEAAELDGDFVAPGLSHGEGDFDHVGLLVLQNLLSNGDVQSQFDVVPEHLAGAWVEVVSPDVVVDAAVAASPRIFILQEADDPRCKLTQELDGEDKRYDGNSNSTCGEKGTRTTGKLFTTHEKAPQGEAVHQPDLVVLVATPPGVLENLDARGQLDVVFVVVSPAR